MSDNRAISTKFICCDEGIWHCFFQNFQNDRVAVASPRTHQNILCVFSPICASNTQVSCVRATKPCLKVILIIIILSLFYLQIQDSFITCIAMNVYAYVQNWIQ